MNCSVAAGQATHFCYLYHYCYYFLSLRIGSSFGVFLFQFFTVPFLSFFLSLFRSCSFILLFPFHLPTTTLKSTIHLHLTNKVSLCVTLVPLRCPFVLHRNPPTMVIHGCRREHRSSVLHNGSQLLIRVSGARHTLDSMTRVRVHLTF